MARWLVDKYGEWCGSAQEFYNANIQSGQLSIGKKPNSRDFERIGDTLKQYGINYVQHSNGLGGAKHEFSRLTATVAEESNRFIELSDNKTWEDLMLQD